MSEDMKPCDCGVGKSELVLWGDYDEGPQHVWCTNCDKEGPSKPTKAEAITAWNTRAGDAP